MFVMGDVNVFGGGTFTSSGKFTYFAEGQPGTIVEYAVDPNQDSFTAIG